MDLMPREPQFLRVPTPEEVRAQPGFRVLSPERAWDRPAPGFALDLSGRDRVLPLQKGARVRLQTQGRFANSYEGQFVFGTNHFYACIGTGMEVNIPETDRYRSRLDLQASRGRQQGVHVPAIRKEGEGYIVDFAPVAPQGPLRIEGDVLLGSPIEPLNWGMWLLQGLPTACAYVAAGSPGKLLCYCDRPWQRRLLALAGVADARLVHHDPRVTYWCDRVSLLQAPYVDLVVTRAERACFDDLADRFAPSGEARRPERIFVSRRALPGQSPGVGRILLNEAELVAAMERRGFAVVEPETLPFEEQAAIFKAAKVVVGLGGVGMFNVVFSRPGTKVISIEGSTAFAHNHANLFASLGHEYGFIFGRDDESAGMHPHNPWTLDVERAVCAIDAFA